jgi:hypothetical protein
MLLSFCLFVCPLAHAVDPIQVPMNADRWHGLEADNMGPKGNVEFSRKEGFPLGMMTLKEGSAALDGVTFKDGTIEFDFKPLDADMPGIQFRVNGAGTSENAEEVYFRTFPDCRGENDCLQYTPVIHGFTLWNVYPQYQNRAFVLDGWNHVRLVISGHRMTVYVNDQPQPALSVGNLEGESMDGTIHLRGPAVYANLVITPGAVDNLPPQPTPDPTDEDSAIVRHWQLSGLIPYPALKAPAYSEMPTAVQSWHAVDAERGGLVNLNRQYAAGDQPAAISWLRYSVDAKQPGMKQVSLGWLGEVWIYVNGKLVTDAKNFYSSKTERRGPDGRLSLENDSFDLPLHAGTNEVVIAMYPGIHDDLSPRTKWGWGIVMRYSDMSGLSFAPTKTPAM